MPQKVSESFKKLLKSSEGYVCC